ncbi:hypothetical protein [Mycolicibacterium helvum]|uniref:Uncharacterized protein n=1 Tax=Mycolicibacterium helvum TaxID=1534349 RepID=A0A7I7SZT5_9MYCO|nr:hypothetical protein [Mycolicibacterium helvum]BBY62193.1 hypothetical protein MHEL_04360 [Mycolicibacterium helvum]
MATGMREAGNTAARPFGVGDKIGTTTVVGVRKVHKGCRVLDVERRDGAYRRFWTSLWPNETGSPALSLEFASQLEIVHPGWLYAVGDGIQVEVMRSPLVRDDNDWLDPVLQYIAEQGLALASRETFEDPDWMFGKVEISVYVTSLATAG